MKLTKLALLFAATAMFALGCSDDDSNDTNQTQTGDQKTGDDQKTDDDKKTDDKVECTKNLCMVEWADHQEDNSLELGPEYKICNNGKWGEDASCQNGQICLDGGCVDAFEVNSKDACYVDPTDTSKGSQPVGYGKCTANGNNAIVCGSKGALKVWTCLQPCSDGANGIVNCPDELPEEEKVYECNPKEFKVSCSADGSTVTVCKKHIVTEWKCANNDCSVNAAKNEITKCTHEDETGALKVGGNIGDACSYSDYQENCGTGAFGDYAVKCYGGSVDIVPCGSCKTTAGSKTVTCDGEPTCDASVDVDPHCEYDGKIITYCTNNNVWEIAACDNCDGSKDSIIACMMN